MKLGAVLKKYRIWREITVRELAKEIGISFPTLSRIEHGNNCDSDTLVRLIVWLNSPDTEAKNPAERQRSKNA